MYTTLSIFNV